MNTTNKKPTSKIQINNILLTEKLEIGRYSSDDLSLENKVLNILDNVALNFDISENGYDVNSTVGIAPIKAIIFNTRFSDSNMAIMRNSDDYVKGNIGNNFSKYQSVMGKNKDLNFIKEDSNINKTLIINRGIQVYLAKAKASKKEKSITMIHFLYELSIGANSSLLNEVKPNVNGALNLKDTEKVFLTKGFVINPKIERHNRRGYLPSIIEIKSSVVSEVFKMYENIYEYFKKEFDNLISDSIESIALIHDENGANNGKPKTKTPKAYMVQISAKEWVLMTTEEIESKENKENALSKITKSEFMKLLDNGTKIKLSKELNAPNVSKAKTVNPNTEKEDAKQEIYQEVIDASNLKNKMENGQQVINKNSTTK